MKPTVIGWISILVGCGIVFVGAISGGNLLVIGVGLLAIAAGGSTKRKP